MKQRQSGVGRLSQYRKLQANTRSNAFAHVCEVNRTLVLRPIESLPRPVRDRVQLFKEVDAYPPCSCLTQYPGARKFCVSLTVSSLTQAPGPKAQTRHGLICNSSGALPRSRVASPGLRVQAFVAG